jgi:tetratricopeptide (TPR) repeat protein
VSAACLQLFRSCVAYEQLSQQSLHAPAAVCSGRCADVRCVLPWAIYSHCALTGYHWVRFAYSADLMCGQVDLLTSSFDVCAAAGLQNWAEAERCFGKAASLAPSFSFAAANHTLALYQLGRTEEAIRCGKSQQRVLPQCLFRSLRSWIVAHGSAYVCCCTADISCPGSHGQADNCW